MDNITHKRRKKEYLERYSGCSTYYDFRDANVLVEDKTLKGDYFEIFTEGHFLTNPNFVGIENFWLRHAVPLEVLEKMGLVRNDKGIDFIVEHDDGSYSLGQCKFVWDEDRTLAKKYLDSFFSEVSLVSKRVTIKNKYVVTTALDIHEYIKQLDGLFVINNSRLNDTADMKNIALHLKSQQAVYKYLDRHELTKRVIKKSRAHFKKHDKGRLIIFCGGRKTLTSLDISLDVLLDITGVLKKKFNKTARVAFGAPSIPLLTQTLDAWAYDLKARGIPFDFRVVCSDPTAQNVEADDRSYGTYDINEVKTWYADKKKELKIVFTTFDSAEIAATIGEYDFTVIDEAHVTATRSDSCKAFITSDAFRSKKKLFQTATEKVINSENGIEEYYSMDNEEQYGKVIDRLTYSMLVKANIIVPIELVVQSSKEWNKLPKSERDAVEQNFYYKDGERKNVPAKDMRTAAMLKKFLDELDDYHVIYGCNRNERAADIADYLSHVIPDANLFNVNGDMLMNKRSEIMKKFERSKNGIVTNCRCLGVGISVDKVNVVVMGDPMQSKIGISQLVGRVSRKGKNKPCGYVFIPIQSDHYTKGELKADLGFNTATCLISTIIANDPSLMTVARARYGKGKKSGKARVACDAKDEEIFDRLFGNLVKDKALYEHITSDVVRKLNAAGLWVEITKDEFLYYKKNGYTTQQVASEKGCCTRSVDNRCIMEYNVSYGKFRGRGFDVKPLTIEDLQYCKNQGMDTSRAAQHLGKSEASIDMYAKMFPDVGMTYKRWIKYKTPEQFAKEWKPKFIECKKKNLTVSKAMCVLRIDYKRINKYCFDLFKMNASEYLNPLCNTPMFAITKEKLLDYKDRGLTRKEVAKIHDCTTNAVDDAVKREFKKTYVKWSKNKFKRLVFDEKCLQECKRLKLSVHEAAKKYNVSITCVFKNAVALTTLPYGKYVKA